MRNEKGQFEKGFGGRLKGSKNKVSKTVGELLVRILSKQFYKIEEDMNSLTPKERLDVLSKLLPYIVSKRSSGFSFVLDVDEDFYKDAD